MANIKAAFGGNASLTITLNSLAASATAGRASTFVDNATTLYLDALLFLTLVTGAGTIGGDKAAYVFAYGSIDATNYSEGVTGTDAAFTILAPTNLRQIAAVNLLAVSTTYRAGPYSVAAAFGGVLPPRWGIVVVNNSGVALGAASNAAVYNGVYATSA